MRNILFRGKRADNGEWTEGFYVRLFEKKNGFYQANHYIFDGNIRLGEERYAGHGNYYQDVIICKKKIDEKNRKNYENRGEKFKTLCYNNYDYSYIKKYKDFIGDKNLTKHIIEITGENQEIML